MNSRAKEFANIITAYATAYVPFLLMQWCTHQQVRISEYDPATRTKGIGVGRYDSICRSHRIDSSDLRRGDLGGSRTAWRSALRGRRSLWWCWRRASFFQTTFLGASPVHPTSWAAAFRSAGAPAPTCHSRPSGLRAVAGISAADS